MPNLAVIQLYRVYCDFRITSRSSKFGPV